MRTHRRTTAARVILALAGPGLLGLTACAGAPSAGSTAAGSASVETGVAALDLVADLGVAEQALTALGFDPAELGVPAEAAGVPAAAAGVPAAAEPGASPGAGKGEKHRKRPLRRDLLRGRVLHAEAVVQTKEGTKTVISQRGTITAIDDTSVSVKSTDGFALTWTFGEKLRVVERRRAVQPSDLAVGAEIGVAGTEDGDRSVAQLIVRRAEK